MEVLAEKKISSIEEELLTERGKISADRMDISFGEIMNLYINGEIKIKPEFQRNFRWTEDQKTALLESLLLGIPIPPIFVAEDEFGVWELIDGLQRVSTFLSFFGELKLENPGYTYLSETDDSISEDGQPTKLTNKWMLGSGAMLKNLDGYTIDSLPNKLKLLLKRSTCRVEIIKWNDKSDIRFELFRRLNSNGTHLTPQEIRNAIFRGIDSRLNTLLINLSKNDDFINLTKLSKRKKDELYDQELVLRFFAFYNNAEKIADNIETFLTDFMSKSVKDTHFSYIEYEQIFIETINLLKPLGEQVFRTPNNSFFTPSIYEGIMIGVAQNIKNFKENEPLLIEKIELLKNDADFKKYSGTASGSKNRAKNRLTRANSIFKS